MKNLQNTLSELRRNKLVWNLLLIVLIILAMAVIAHFVMQAGTRHGARRTVPDFSGIALGEAQRIARANDLRLHINDSLFVPAYQGGTVLDQLPEGGVEVKPGRTVYITINAFRQKQVPVPYVAGRSLRQAKNMLEIAGLEIERLVYRPDIATNYVLEEYCDNRPVRPESKIEAEAGSGVTLYVGVQTGDSLTIVPQVIGATLRQAKSPAVGAGSQRRADRLRRRHRPHQPEGRPGLHPDPGSRTGSRAGHSGRAAADARRGQADQVPLRSDEAGRCGSRRAHALGARTRFAARGRCADRTATA